MIEASYRQAESDKQAADNRDDQINDLAETICREIIDTAMSKGIDAPVSFHDTTETLWQEPMVRGKLQRRTRPAMLKEIIIEDDFGVLAMNALILIAKKGDIDAIATIRAIASKAATDIAADKVDA
jgi:hypothetical protein